MSLLDLIKERRSVRSFDGRPLTEEDRTKLEEYAKTIEPLFDIPVGYAFLEGGKDGLGSQVLVGDRTFLAGKVKRVPYAEVAFGYEFEKLILYAWSIGIGSVWIAGTMKRSAFEKAAGIKEDEMMPCITPLGYEAEKMSMREKLMRKGVKADSRKPAGELFFDKSFNRPMNEDAMGEFADLFEMVRWAPSAVNKQPWRIGRRDGKYHFYKKGDKGYVSEEVGDMQRIDLGIALCHFVMAVEESGRKASVVIEDPAIETQPGIEYIASVAIIG